jgi:integrase
LQRSVPISLIKIAVFVSNVAMPPKPFQLDSELNGASNLSGALSMACQKAQPYVAAARAAGTRRVYAGAWARFEAWCALVHAPALPAAPETVAAYLGYLADAGRSVATIKVAVSAILFAHKEAGADLDRAHGAIQRVMAGIARKSSRPIKRATPLELEELRHLSAGIKGVDLRALRDRALLLVGFFGALRRSELASLDLTGRSPIEIREEGLVLHLTASKASSKTQSIVIPRRRDPLCAVAAIEQYVDCAGIRDGPVFRAIDKGGRLGVRRLDVTSMRYILQKRAGARRSLTPHSLRIGFITSAAKAGAPEHVIQRTTRHKSVEVLRGYIRSSNAFDDCAAAYLE